MEIFKLLIILYKEKKEKVYFLTDSRHVFRLSKDISFFNNEISISDFIDFVRNSNTNLNFSGLFRQDFFCLCDK